MEGLEVFYTELEENTRTFYPGEAVYGEVLLKTSEEMRFKELRLHCTGEASVSWPESSGCYSRYHHNREQYFDTAASITDRAVPLFKNLYKRRRSLPRSKSLPVGNYSFPFKFLIPDKYLPPSFEGTHGYIRYWVQAIIDRGFGKHAVKTKAARFTIGDFVSIERFENAKEPIQSELSRPIGCCPYDTEGSLTVSARADKTAYEQGETVQLHVAVSNQTRHHVTSVGVSLVQKIVYRDVEREKTNAEITVTSTVVGHVIRNSDAEFSAMPLTIPPRLIPTLLTCKCLTVCYFLEITVKLKRKLTKKSIIQLPIVVASASQKPCQPNGFNNNNTNSHTLQKRWTTYYLTGTPSRRPKEPLVIPNGQYGFCSPAQCSPDKSPKRAGAQIKAAVFCMVGSPVTHKEKVVVV